MAQVSGVREGRPWAQQSSVAREQVHAESQKAFAWTVWGRLSGCSQMANETLQAPDGFTPGQVSLPPTAKPFCSPLACRWGTQVQLAFILFINYSF